MSLVPAEERPDPGGRRSAGPLGAAAGLAAIFALASSERRTRRAPALPAWTPRPQPLALLPTRRRTAQVTIKRELGEELEGRVARKLKRDHRGAELI